MLTISEIYEEVNEGLAFPVTMSCSVMLARTRLVGKSIYYRVEWTRLFLVILNHWTLRGHLYIRGDDLPHLSYTIQLKPGNLPQQEIYPQ
jgi:hypothetical protein